MRKNIFLIVLLLLGVTANVDSNDLIKFNSELIDTTVNPGDDFYHFASGLWLKNETQPEGSGRFGFYNLADKQIELDIINLLNGHIEFDSSNQGANLVKYLYQSAMDTVDLNNRGIDLIKNELKLIDSIQTLADLQKVLTTFILIGIDPFFELYRPKSWQILDTNYPVFSQTRFGLNSTDYSGDINNQRSKLGQYKLFIDNLLGEVIDDKSKIEHYSRNIISIESELASKMMSSSKLRNFSKTYNVYKIKKLKSLIPQFEWESLLRDFGVSTTDKVVIGQPKYFKAIGKILKSYDIDILKGYLKFVLIYRTSALLNNEISQLFWEFKIKNCGWQKISRKIMVYDIIIRDFSDIVGFLFLENYFPPAKYNNVLEMITNLKTAFKNKITNNSAISKSSKESIIKKLNNMKFLIGGSKINVDYANLPKNESGFLSTLFAAREYSNKRYLSKMGTPKDYEAWTVEPFSTNAWYSHSRNRITLPAGNINGFWSDDDAWNYGTLGATIAHEITHGFDTDGRKYDENGNSIGFWKKMKDWWDADDNHFEDCSEHLKARYNGFVVLDSFSVNGEKTLNENLADLGGLSIAFDAYLLSLDGQESESINGYNGSQRFFLSYAQKWRELFEEETLIRSLDGYHAPPEYRTNGVIYNISGFNEAFKITESDKMYLSPEERIIIW